MLRPHSVILTGQREITTTQAERKLAWSLHFSSRFTSQLPHRIFAIQIAQLVNLFASDPSSFSTSPQNLILLQVHCLPQQIFHDAQARNWSTPEHAKELSDTSAMKKVRTYTNAQSPRLVETKFRRPNTSLLSMEASSRQLSDKDQQELANFIPRLN